MTHPDPRLVDFVSGRWGNDDGSAVNMAHALNWTPTLISEVTVNDSDKSIAVTASRHWEIQFIWVDFTTTGDAGTRQIVVELQDGSSNVLMIMAAGVTQGISVTRKYLFSSDVPDLVAFRDTDTLTTPIPSGIILPAGFVIRIYDRAVIQVAADDMVIRMMVNQRIVP